MNPTACNISTFITPTIPIQPTREELVTMDQMLEGWMETYERSIFNGKTLDEMVGNYSDIKKTS